MTLKYTEGYKYQLAEDYSVLTPVNGAHIEDEDFTLYESGLLVIYHRCAWDGASGPTFDTKASMGPSLVHDVFCRMMRDGRLSYDQWQDTINEFFRQQCKAAGMWGWRADLWHAGVEFGDAGNPDQGPDRKLLTAP